MLDMLYVVGTNPEISLITLSTVFFYFILGEQKFVAL